MKSIKLGLLLGLACISVSSFIQAKDKNLVEALIYSFNIVGAGLPDKIVTILAQTYTDTKNYDPFLTGTAFFVLADLALLLSTKGIVHLDQSVKNIYESCWKKFEDGQNPVINLRKLPRKLIEFAAAYVAAIGGITTAVAGYTFVFKQRPL